ncbi:hypothetical protein RJT34_13057 [Clitoria ternatea]|uniref:Secreted protein n=1 Tax=Clitoria ternatea TaxID=43366 RepID=A0AAN9JMV4_CLITE
MMSSDSRAMVFLMFVLMVTRVPIAVTASTIIEHCLRLGLNPPPPPPPAPPAATGSGLGLSRTVCRDVFRVLGHSPRLTGTLRFDYIAALCAIFRYDQHHSHL